MKTKIMKFDFIGWAVKNIDNQKLCHTSDNNSYDIFKTRKEARNLVNHYKKYGYNQYKVVRVLIDQREYV